jgi:hypothetical protein
VVSAWKELTITLEIECKAFSQSAILWFLFVKKKARYTGTGLPHKGNEKHHLDRSFEVVSVQKQLEEHT